MHRPAWSGDMESSGARSWSSPGDPALPIPGAQAVAQAGRDRHVPEQPAGEHKAKLLTSQRLRARLAQRLPPAAAQGEPEDAAPVCSVHPTAAPHTGMGGSAPGTIQAWRCDHISMTPAHHMWRKHRERGWIKQEK